MKRTVILAALCFMGASSLLAQTKKIAHRSHSGKNSTLIFTTEDNFGLPASAKKKDTVIVKSDSVRVKKVYRKKKKTVVKNTAVKK